MKEEEKNHETTGKKTTLTDKIYQDIKDDILTKVFQPGEKLNIKELAREYQVSDTPVKQALQRLAAGYFRYASDDGYIFCKGYRNHAEL